MKLSSSFGGWIGLICTSLNWIWLQSNLQKDPGQSVSHFCRQSTLLAPQQHAVGSDRLPGWIPSFGFSDLSRFVLGAKLV